MRYRLLQLQNNKQQAKGFTIAELMIAVALLGVISAFALPAFSTFSERRQADRTYTEMADTLLFARSQAIARRQVMRVTPEAGGWQNGWRVTNMGTNQVVKQSTLASPDVNLTVAANGVANLNQLDFDQRGRATTGSLKFTFCNDSLTGELAKVIDIRATGLIEKQIEVPGVCT